MLHALSCFFVVLLFYTYLYGFRANGKKVTAFETYFSSTDLAENVLAMSKEKLCMH